MDRDTLSDDEIEEALWRELVDALVASGESVSSALKIADAAATARKRRAAPTAKRLEDEDSTA